MIGKGSHGLMPEIQNLTERIKRSGLQKYDDLETPFITDFNTGQDEYV
jgi:hypothetical protein